MILKTRMKKFLVLILAVTVVPLFMGLICPCADAAPTNEPVLHAAPCHGCCPEMSARGSCDAVTIEKLAVSSSSKTDLLIQDGQAFSSLSPSSFISPAFHRGRDSASPPSFAGAPLYLLNQVFRL